MMSILEILANTWQFLAGRFDVAISTIDISQYPYWYLDILVVAVIFYWILLLLQGTRTVHIVSGLIVLAMIFLLGKYLQLPALNWILTHLLTIVVIAIPIVFQEELRRGLERLGQPRFFNLKITSAAALTQEIVEAVTKMATSKVGALIVLKNRISLKEYIDSGVKLDAVASKELLLNIFYPRSPLHDGAVILEGERVVAAGAVLPLSQESLRARYGTRHKSALGVSEHSDAVAIVVSEERGTISICRDGKMIIDINSEQLEEMLYQFYGLQERQALLKKKRRARSKLWRIRTLSSAEN